MGGCRNRTKQIGRGVKKTFWDKFEHTIYKLQRGRKNEERKRVRNTNNEFKKKMKEVLNEWLDKRKFKGTRIEELRSEPKEHEQHNEIKVIDEITMTMS